MSAHFYSTQIWVTVDLASTLSVKRGGMGDARADGGWGKRHFVETGALSAKSAEDNQLRGNHII